MRLFRILLGGSRKQILFQARQNLQSYAIDPTKISMPDKIKFAGCRPKFNSGTSYQATGHFDLGH